MGSIARHGLALGTPTGAVGFILADLLVNGPSFASAAATVIAGTGLAAWGVSLIRHVDTSYSAAASGVVALLAFPISSTSSIEPTLHWLAPLIGLSAMSVAAGLLHLRLSSDGQDLSAGSWGVLFASVVPTAFFLSAIVGLLIVVAPARAVQPFVLALLVVAAIGPSVMSTRRTPGAIHYGAAACGAVLAGVDLAAGDLLHAIAVGGAGSLLMHSILSSVIRPGVGAHELSAPGSAPRIAFVTLVWVAIGSVPVFAVAIARL